jgi:CRISPR-associated endonuclease Csn1
LTPQAQKRAIGKWRRGASIKLGTLGDWCGGGRSAFDAAAKRRLDGEGTRRTKKQQPVHLSDVLNESFSADLISGRAPFHRSVLREVVEFVFATDKHPSEEEGPLFRSESLRKTQLQRAIEDQTNNHLIRNRLTLLDRLHRDVLKEYAGGDASKISRVTIEVNRDIREFSGKTAKEISMDLGSRLSNFKGVVKKLETDFEGQNIRISPALIRKARIAEDLGWRCPYTGKDYDSLSLAYTRVDKDHIIPRSLRPSDGLDALVITFPEVNKLKGNRTALRFVEEFQGKPVPGRPDLTVVTLKQYEAFVEKLDTSKGHDDDKKRKRRRKEALQIKDYVDKEFTPRDLTQTSHLVRLGAQLLERVYIQQEQKPVITSIPGSVTGAVRKSWRLTGCLAGINQSLPADSEDISKSDLRESTHMHHALDACVQALASHLLPRDGGIWEILLKRRLNAQEQQIARTRLKDIAKVDAEGRLRLADLPVPLKTQIRQRLFEKRVVQHIPADQGGMACDQTVWRVVDPLDDHPSAKRLAKWFKALNIEIPTVDAETVLIVCRKRKDGPAEGGKLLHAGKVWRWVYDLKAKSALLGLSPQDPAKAKLKRIKAVKVLGDNYGLALDPAPVVLRPIKVWEQLAELRARNGGKRPRVLRIGSIVEIPNKTGRSDYRGIWMVRGVQYDQKAGFLLNLSGPDKINYKESGQSDAFRNVRLTTLISDGLTLFLGLKLTGLASQRPQSDR